MHLSSTRPLASHRTTTVDSTSVLAFAVLGFLHGCGGAQRPLDEAHFEDHGFEPVHVPDVPLPDPADASPVSLVGILAYADAHAPRLGVARAREGLGDAAVQGAETLVPHNPELTVAAGPRVDDDGELGLDLRGGLSQTFEIAGERGARIDAAERTRDRLAAELDEARTEVHREVHAAFHRALVAREREAAAERLVAFQERLLEVARRRLAAGDVPQLAERVAEGELAQAQVARIRARGAYATARLELAGASGWPAEHPPEPSGTLDDPRDPPERSALLALARRHQPRLRTLHAMHEEAVAHAEAADRDGWPEPTIGVEVEREGAPNGLSETVIVGTLGLPIPVFERNQAERARTEAEVAVVLAEEEAYTRALAIRVEEERLAVLGAAERVRAYGGEIVPRFEENLRLIERAFELGEIDIIEVSVARERFLHVRTEVLDAYEDYFAAVAELEATVGTDLWPDEHHEGER
jgi:outer membrane protein, heavy metal efflux system